MHIPIQCTNFAANYYYNYYQMNSKVNTNDDEEEELSIVPIFEDNYNLLSIKFGDKLNEYDYAFDRLNDLDYLQQFFKENEDYLSRPAWSKIPTIESAVRQVRNEAIELEDRLEEYSANATMGRTPDLDSLFQFLGGSEFEDVYELAPMKAYGPGRPSMIRIYALKLQPNRYVVTGAGIKLHDSIQSSPGIKDYVLQDIRRTRQWLLSSGILN